MGNNGAHPHFNEIKNLYSNNQLPKNIRNITKKPVKETKNQNKFVKFKLPYDYPNRILNPTSAQNLPIKKSKSKNNSGLKNFEITIEEVSHIKKQLEFDNGSSNISSKENSPSCNLISERFEINNSQIPKKPNENLIIKAKNKISGSTLEDVNDNPFNINKLLLNLKNPPFCNYCRTRLNSPKNSNLHNEKKINCIGKIVRTANYTKELERLFPYDILYEKYLIKCFGGVNQVKLRRFCRLTRNEFQYFKDRYNAELYEARPLVAIPIYCIEYARLINLPEEEKNKLKDYECKNNYMFEIYAPQLNLFANKNNPSRTPSHSSKITETIFNKTLNLQEINQKQHDFSPLANCLKSPIIRNHQNIPFNGNNINKSSNGCFLQEIFFKNEKEALNFYSFTITKGQELAIPLKILDNSLYSINKSCFKRQTWSFREIDWLLSDSRFIFSSDNLEECLKFVYLINWLKQ